MNDTSACVSAPVEEPKTQIPPAKRELPPNLQKICLVCGDKALGYNFNALSCESCKAFFRRNALTSKEFKCPFTNSCEITVVTRRFCQKCRLVKCLAIGMVKEFIMSDEDKAEKKKRIEENRAKKRQQTDVSQEPVSSSKSFKRGEDVTTEAWTAQPPDSGIVQYDVLNSTTCSPHSSVQSPLRNDLDSTVQSPPVYNSQYIPQQSTDYQYPAYQEQQRYIEVPPHQLQYPQNTMDGYSMDGEATMFEKKNNIK